MARSKNWEQSILSVKDFGPIANAAVELRPFTVFVGPSNIGKSYLAILLYALHQFFSARGASRRPGTPWLFPYFSRVDRKEPTDRLETAKTMQVAFTRLLASVVRSGVRVVVTTHSEWVLETLANLVRLSEVDTSRRTEVSLGAVALRPDQVGAWLFEPKKRPKGSVVKEIPLDVASGTFPAGFNEVTEALYNNWAEIANLVAERGK